MRHTTRPPVLVVVVTALAAVASPARAAGAPPEPPLLVMPLVAPDLGSAERDAVEDAIHAAAARRVPAELNGRQATRTLIQDASSAGLTCPLDAVDCAARLGAIAEVAEVILPVVVGSDAVRLTLVDVANQRGSRIVVGRVLLPARDGGRSVRDLLTRLEVPPALLDIDARPPGAAVLLDGMRLGTAPLSGPASVAPGAHELAVEPPQGAASVRKTIVVEPGARVTISLDASSTAQAVQVAVEQPPAAQSPLYLPGIVTAGVGVAGVVVGAAGLGAMEVALQTPSANEDAEELRRAGVGFAIGLGVSTVVAVAGAAMLGQVFSQ